MGFESHSLEKKNVPNTKNARWQNNSNNLSLNLYPNPANEFVNIDIDYLIDNVQIIDALGKEIKYLNIENNRINIKNFKSGMYFLKINSEGKNFYQKFIKN